METLLIHRDILRTPLFDQIIDMLRNERVKHQMRKCDLYLANMQAKVKDIYFSVGGLFVCFSAIR